MCEDAKEQIRADMRRRRRDVRPDDLQRASETVQRTATGIAALREARTVGCYLATPGEVQTDRLLAWLHGERKDVCVPAWDADTGRYALVRMRAGDEPVPGPHGAPEPVGAERITNTAVDVFLVPGLAFDRQGARLGHGGGHFDRLLAASADTLRIGLAFAWQVVPELPTAPHDEGMDLVITETETFHAPGRSNRKPV